MTCALAILGPIAPPRGAAQTAEYDAFEAARKLETSGQLESAFLAYAELSGAESHAARIARPEAAAYLELLEAHADDLPVGAVNLLRGDLLLAGGKDELALASYRTAAAVLSAGHALSNTGYWVEPPTEGETYRGPRPVAPFEVGPGSHRDNWLVRRFIALEAWDDVGIEMQRVWEIHRSRAAPYRTMIRIYCANDEPVSEERLVRPAGFNGQGLQFALDYAFFLKQRDELPAALDVLREALLQIDCEKNPNLVEYLDMPAGAENEFPLRDDVSSSRRLRPFGRYGGISRKEFIRLAWGVFKNAGRAETLEATLCRRAENGENHLRRVLARICYHEGRGDDALAFELAYIEHGGFNALSRAVRRGEAYEEASRPAEAIEEYERALKLPLEPLDRPDPEEQLTQRFAQQAIAFPGPAAPLGKEGLHAEMLGRLVRLHGGLGHVEKAFERSLRQIEASPQMISSIGAIEQVANRARAIGRDKQFEAWLRKMATTVEPPLSKAAAYWVLQEYETCAALVAPAVANDYGYQTWRERFAGVGALRRYIDAVLEENPSHARARLDRLELMQDFDGPAAIRTLEMLLDGDASEAFARGKGIVNRTRFRGYYDLAYRLMRLYEKHAEEAKLVDLGMRIVRGEKPFERNSGPQLRDLRANWGGRSEREDLLNCLYALMPHVDAAEDARRMTEFVETSGSIPLKNQWAKLRSAQPTRLDPSERVRRSYEAVEVRTLRLPEGVKMLTHRDDVRAIGPDGKWIGTSWGLVRYRTGDGGELHIAQIPLGCRVTSFLRTPAGLFVGTRGGLHRIDSPDGPAPTVVRIDLESVYKAVEPMPINPQGSSFRRIDSQQMLWWEDALWVSDGAALFRYDPVVGAARYFGRVSCHPFAAAGTLWVNLDHATMARYDGESEEFEPFPCPFERGKLIGASRGQVWADVYVDNDRRHRPAIIDPETSEVRVLPVYGARPEKPLLINHEFRIVADDGRIVWLTAAGLARYDRRTDRLTCVERNEGEPAGGHVGPVVWVGDYDKRLPPHRFHFGSGTLERIPDLNLHGDRGPYFCSREYEDRLLLGAAVVREWSEDNLGFDDNTGMSHHVQDLEGGLFEVDARTLAWQKLGARDGELSDFYVKRVVIDERDDRAYVCTNGGVTILSLPSAEPIGRITVSDGLPSNKVEDVARIGDRLYLACELGDEDGGLAVMDLKTGFLDRLTTADGLKCNKIKQLRADGTKLHILYGTLYGVRARNTDLSSSMQARGADSRVRTFKSSILDTETGKLIDGDEVLPAPSAPDPSRRLPWLGGAVLCDVTYQGTRLIGGTHGLLVVPAGETVEADPGPQVVAVRVERSLRQRQLAAALDVNVPRGLSPDELEEWLDHENPFVRAEAMKNAWDEIREQGVTFTPLLARQVADPFDRIAATAVFLLTEIEGERPIEPLRRALESPVLECRALAAVELAERGKRPAMSYFEEIFEKEAFLGNHPFGAQSSVGVQVGHEIAAAALAVDADREAFAFLLKHPTYTDDYEPRQLIFKRLGDSLRKRAELAGVLLSAYTAGRDPGPETNYGAARFAQEVFRHSGSALLPQLHDALRSEDRVVRSNAARACGAIGDASSIRPLIESLDLESGLSRASIVWALGQLRAEEALPHLAALYADAKNDERRRQGGGFRMAQAVAQLDSHYESLGNLDSIRSDWDQLARPLPTAVIDPKENEWLLNPAIILDAVRKIGPAASQAFYRRLATESDGEARREAAIRLSECEDEDRDANIPILRNLLGDSTQAVQIAAAVSLLLLGHEEMETQIVAWLDSPDYASRYQTIGQLERVADGGRLRFARSSIQRIVRDPARAWESDRRAARLLERIPSP